VEKMMASPSDSDDNGSRSGDLSSWTEVVASSPKGDEAKGSVTATGVSAEKLLVQMTDQIDAIQKQVCWSLLIRR